MRVTQVGYTYDPELRDPDQLLAAYRTLTEWGEALLAAGAERVGAVQRFHRAASIVRNGIAYEFCPRGSLHATVRRSAPAVAHVNGLEFPLQTWWLRRVLPRPAVVVVQDHASGAPSIGTPRSWRTALRRRPLRAADGFLFTAAAQAESWRAAGAIGPRQQVCEVLEASTTLQPVDRAEARSVTGTVGQPSALWVGRFNRNKDPLTVLDGFERSLPTLPAAELTMIFGADDLLPDVRARVQRSPGLVQRVRLVGAVPRSRLAAYYTAADLFVLGSHHEGSGYALLEACACGAIPVVTDIPSFRRITAGGRIGALWPSGDANALASRLVEVGRSDLAARRGETRAHFDRELSWAAVGRRALEAYSRIQKGSGLRVATSH